MKNYLVSFFIHRAQRVYPEWYRLLTLFGTIFFVYGILPFFYLYFGRLINISDPFFVSTYIGVIIAILTVPVGVFLIGWTLYVQFTVGSGSGSHMAPPKQLMVTGLYHCCQHPMQLGAIIYYFGICTLFGSLTTGVLSALVTYGIGVLFHTFVEERVLEYRFGDSYRMYRKNTPSYLPRVTCLVSALR